MRTNTLLVNNTFIFSITVHPIVVQYIRELVGPNMDCYMYDTVTYNIYKYISIYTSSSELNVCYTQTCVSSSLTDSIAPRLDSSWRQTWGCGTTPSEKERAAYELIRDEHHQLGPMRYGEVSVLALFILMVALWFTRDPRFMVGWATHVFNAKSE